MILERNSHKNVYCLEIGSRVEYNIAKVYGSMFNFANCVCGFKKCNTFTSAKFDCFKSFFILNKDNGYATKYIYL